MEPSELLVASSSNSSSTTTSPKQPIQSTLHVRPRVFLVMENRKGKRNVLGPVLRCAAAFDVEEVVWIGDAKCSVQGSHGASRHLKYQHFPTADQAETYLRNERSVRTTVGVFGANYNPNVHCGSHGIDDAVRLVDRVWEDDDSVLTTLATSSSTSMSTSTSNSPPRWSYPIHLRRFGTDTEFDGNFNVNVNVNANVALVVSQDRRGMPSSLSTLCDVFVHVPICGNGNGLLNSSREKSLGNDDTHNQNHSHNHNQYALVDLPACLSIVLHHYTAWACYDERQSQGHKFVVDEERRAVPVPHKPQEKPKKKTTSGPMPMSMPSSESVDMDDPLEDDNQEGWGSLFEG